MNDPLDEGQVLEEAFLLIRRLERLSADSTWARRASGCRGALLKLLDESQRLPAGVPAAEQPKPDLDLARLRFIMEKGFEMLVKAAREIPDLENIR